MASPKETLLALPNKKKFSNNDSNNDLKSMTVIVARMTSIRVLIIVTILMTEFMIIKIIFYQLKFFITSFS